MPKRPRSPCRFAGCPELTEGLYCDKHRKLKNRYYNKYKRDPNTYKRYGTRWRRIRQLYIKEHPVCEVCEKQGKITPVQEVHHIIPLSRGGTHHEDNLMSLCKSCHSRITATKEERWE